MSTWVPRYKWQLIDFLFEHYRHIYSKDYFDKFTKKELYRKYFKIIEERTRLVREYLPYSDVA